MEKFNKDALPNGTQLQSGKFIIDHLFSDKGGFSLIYEGRAIRKVEDNFFGRKQVNTIEEKVIIKELYFKDKAERREGQTTLTWRPKDFNDKELIDKFKEKTKSEGEKLANLVHKSPYIIVIYAAFEENNTVYLVTKKIEKAVDFHTIIKGDDEKGIMPHKLSVQENLRYIKHICQALQVVHNNNIIHLDIKPGNILRDGFDNAILIDFGISVSLVKGRIETLLEGAISPHYSPPEQGSKDKKNIGFYSDIYALGATMYFFFTGGELPPEYATLISAGETFLPPSHYNTEVSEYLDSIIIKCLSISFKDRYQTMEELIKALEGEATYNRLVAGAHQALRNKEYEKGIEAIVTTEELIPLTMELHSLKYELQKGREQSRKDEQNKQQFLKAQELIRKHRYMEAIDLLQLLPENDEIKVKIVYCNRQLLEQEFTGLLKDAAFYEDNGQLEKALDTYLEAKKLKQSNQKVNAKIETLKQHIEKKKEQESVAIVLQEYKQETISFAALQTTVEKYVQKYPKDKKIAQQWQKLQAARKLEEKEREYHDYLEKAEKANSYQESLELLGKIPSDSQYYAEAVRRIAQTQAAIAVQKEQERREEEKRKAEITNQQYLHKAEKANSYQESLELLGKIPSDSQYYAEAVRRIAQTQAAIAAQKEQEHREEENKKAEIKHKQYVNNANKAESLATALVWWQKIPEDSKYYDTATQKITDIRVALAKQEADKQYDQNLRDAKTKIAQDDKESAKTLLLDIPTEAKSYQEAQTLLKDFGKTVIIPDEPEPDTVPKPKKKLWLWIVLGVVSVCIIVVLLLPNAKEPTPEPIINIEGNTDENKEEEAWNALQAKPIPTKDDYQTFLKAYPMGKHSEKATQKLQEYREAEKLQAEEKEKAEVKAKEKDAWTKAQRTKTINAYRQYVKKYPQGEYVQEAKNKIATLQKAKAKAKAKAKKIANYESQANNYKANSDYVSALKQLQYAQNLQYSNSRSNRISSWKAEGDKKARAIVLEALAKKNSKQLAPCGAILKAYYKKASKLTSNQQIVAAIKCSN